MLEWCVNNLRLAESSDIYIFFRSQADHSMVVPI